MEAKAIRKILGKFGYLEGGTWRKGECHVIDLNEAWKELEALEKTWAEGQLETDVRQQLRSFLEGLEIENIDKLLLQPPEFFKDLGKTMASIEKTRNKIDSNLEKIMSG